MAKHKKAKSVSEARRRAMGKGRYIVVYRDLIFSLGIELAVVIGFLENHADLMEGEGRYLIEDGHFWFPCSTEFVRKRCHLSRRIHDRIMHDLEERGIILRRMLGNPARRHIAIDTDIIKKEKRKGAEKLWRNEE